MSGRWLTAGMIVATLVGCSSAQKMRQQEREKLAASSGMYCGFVNGDDYQDIEVQLNLEMARRCDPDRAFTATNYKNASEVHGIVYCCTMAGRSRPMEMGVGEVKSAPVERSKGPDAAEDDKPKSEEKSKSDGLKADGKGPGRAEAKAESKGGKAPAAPSGSSAPSGSAPAESSQPAATEQAPPQTQNKAPSNSKPRAPASDEKSDLEAILAD